MAMLRFSFSSKEKISVFYWLNLKIEMVLKTPIQPLPDPFQIIKISNWYINEITTRLNKTSYGL
jgi:hypothetical protein